MHKLRELVSHFGTVKEMCNQFPVRPNTIGDFLHGRAKPSALYRMALSYIANEVKQDESEKSHV